MARRTAEQVGETLTCHAVADWEVKVIHVQSETAVVANFDQIVEDLVDIFWLTVRCKAHHFVFARVDFETSEASECRIKQTERMRKLNFFDYFERVVATDRKTCCRPLTHAVNGEHCSILKRRRIKR